MRRFVVLPLILVLIAACSPTQQVSPTEPPFFTATAPPLSDFQADTALSGTDIPQEFTGGQPLAVQTRGDFRFVVRGAFESELSTGQVVYNFIPRAGSVFEHNQLYINASDPTSTQQVTLQFATNIGAGNYDIRSGESYVPGFVRAEYVRLGDDGFGNNVNLVFDEVSEGTLTIDNTENGISGRFLFSAQTTRTSDAGESETLEVQIVGEFRNVPLNRLDTPFSFSPIEPTQATPEPRP